MNSKIFFENICKEEACTNQRQKNVHSTNEKEQQKLDCGIYKGYDNLNYYNNNWTSYQKNESQDLRLLKMISQYIPSNINEKIADLGIDENYKKNIFMIVIFLYSVVFTSQYFTIERNEPNNNINNLTDVFNNLTKQVLNPTQISLNNQLYNNKIKIGELHIYCDKSREMEFIESKKSI